MCHFHIKVYSRAQSGAHQQQGSPLVAECIMGSRVIEMPLPRTNGPKTQQAGILISGLGSGTEGSGLENQLDGELVKEIQVVQERKRKKKRKEKERSPDHFPSKKLCHEGANRGLSE